MSPTFSIIIPVYNVAPYLRECLDSILAQTYTDWEAICVDDGSTDGSGAILDEYAAKVEKLGGGGQRSLKVLHQPNCGVSAARNAALDVAQGEWFMFVDGDDRLREDALELLLKNGVDDTTDCVLITPYIPYWDGAAIPPRKLATKVMVDAAAKEDLVLGPYAANGFVISRIYRRSIFGELRFRTDMWMREDVCYWLDALTCSARYRIIQCEYYLYRQRADSVSGSINPHHCEQVLESVLHAFRAIDSGALDVADAKKKYFYRFVWPPYVYLENVCTNPTSLSAGEWRLIGMKLRAIQHVIGRWPGDRIFWKACLATHSALRPFVKCVDYLYIIRHLAGNCLRLVHLRK